MKLVYSRCARHDAPTDTIAIRDRNSCDAGEFFVNTGFAWPSQEISSIGLWPGLEQIFMRGFRLVGPGTIGVVYESREGKDLWPVWAVLAPDSMITSTSAPCRSRSASERRTRRIPVGRERFRVTQPCTMIDACGGNDHG